MAKTIKFNLICDGKPVRTVEDLQNNFVIEDVLAYYNSKLLHRWLNVRGYHDYLEAVENIQNSDPLAIVQNLIKIFAIETDEARIRESIYMMQFQKDREQTLRTYCEHNLHTETIKKRLRTRNPYPIR